VKVCGADAAARSSVLLVLGVAACARAPGPAPPDERPPERRRAEPPAATTKAAPATTTAELPPLLDGCLQDVDLDAGAEVVLGRAGELCLAGMHRVPASDARADGGEVSIEVRVDDPSRCVRTAAAGGPGVAAVAISVIDGAGKRLAEAEPPAPIVWAPSAGPLCLARAGTLRVVARVTRGAGPIAVGIWQAKAD
jgi:hypothetical protein